MMETLERIRRSIETAEELQSVVRTMKAVAAASIRQFEKAAESLGEYSRAVELGFQALLQEHLGSIPAGPVEHAGRLGVIVFGSDQGLAGRFNLQIAEHVGRELAKETSAAEHRVALVVGSRVAGLLPFDEKSIAQVAPASTVGGITSTVTEVLLKVQEWQANEQADRVVLYYNRFEGGASYRPHTQALFPIALERLREVRVRKWPSKRIPLRTAEWERLFASFTREYLYIAIYRAAAESLASENASRLASMQAAERNIDERLEELNMRYRHSRQQSITEELLDIIAGFQALSGA